MPRFQSTLPRGERLIVNVLDVGRESEGRGRFNVLCDLAFGFFRRNAYGFFTGRNRGCLISCCIGGVLVVRVNGGNFLLQRELVFRLFAGHVAYLFSFCSRSMRARSLVVMHP